jgi:hypothetical protein
MAAGTATGNASIGTDTFTGVHQVVGTFFADTFIDAGGDYVYQGVDGDDLFVFADGNGDDFIQGFVAGEGTEDVIDLTGIPGIDTFADVLARTTYQGSGSVAIIDLSAGNSLRLTLLSPVALHPDDFLLA